MNPRTFLKRFAASTDRDRMVDLVYDEMVEYCRSNDIPENEISTTEIERLAEGFVSRGFTFEKKETFDIGLYDPDDHNE